MQFFILGGHLWDQPQAQQIIVYFLLFISCEPSFRSTTIKPITTITTSSSRWKEWPHQPTTSSIWRIGGPHPKFERTTSSSRCRADEGLEGRAGRKRAGEGARTREHSAMLCSPPSLLLKEPRTLPSLPLPSTATFECLCHPSYLPRPSPAHALHFDEVVVRSNVGCGPALDMNKVVNRCSTSLLHLG